MSSNRWFSRLRRNGPQSKKKRSPAARGARPFHFDELEARIALTGTPNPTISTTPEAPQILLTPSALSTLRQEAAANTPQWQAFKAQLDQNLNSVIQDVYQGSDLQWIANYALGYQVLKSNDPTTADNYADKAIAILKSGLHDYKKGPWDTYQFLARGDGSTTTFVLPNADVIPSSIHVYLANVSTQAVVHGTADGQDNVGYYQTFIKVSNTPDGSADYTNGVDYQHSGEYGNKMIDWSLPGAEPALGATYYLTSASGLGAVNTAFTLNGNQITLSSAPTANQAIFVQYVYGTHAADGSTLAYQQTSAGDGGFDSAFIDTTYPSRYLGGYVAIGVDWLDGYVGMSMQLKTEAIDMLQRWYNYLQQNGYNYSSPASNYGAGSYFSNVMTALALEGRSSDGPAFMSDILSYRTNNLVPLLTNGTTSLNGGFWAEGWNYGALATQNVLVAGLALEANGQISAAPEHHWATQVIQQLVADQPSSTTIYDGGDWFTSPAPFPGKDLIDILTTAADDPTTQSYGNYILQNYSGSFSSDFIDLLYRNPGATAAYWSSLPLSNLATGTGLLTVRSDWSATPNWASIQMGNLLQADHQSFTPGQVQIQRGGDDLLVNANALGDNQTNQYKSGFGNTIVVNDNGAGTQTYPGNMGVWYGSPGVVINAYEATTGYTYLFGDYHAAYSLNTNPGAGGPTSELTRQFVYIQPDIVIVYDRVTTTIATDLKQQQWMFSNAPTVSGDSFVETVGSSKLFGQTYSTVPLTTTVAPVTVGSATVQQLITQNASPTASVRYATAFQIAPSSTGAMDVSQHVLSADSQLEGIEVGGYVVLFGRNGNVNTSSAITYQVTSSGFVSHLITNLPAGQNYEIDVNGNPVVVVQASSQGTIHFTTSGSGTQTIRISETNQSPQSPLTLSDSYQLASGSTTVIDATHGVLANDSDPANLTLTATLQTGPAHGFLTLNADGSFTYTKGPGFTGTDSFTYIASDGLNSSGATTVTLTTAPPPTAANDTFTISRSSNSLMVDAAHGVLANDTDPSNLPLTAILRTAPAHGTLTLNADGSFTYTEGLGFSGTDSFTYEATDGQATSSAATVTLTLASLAPTAGSDVYVISNTATSSVGTAQGVLANDINPAGGALTVALQQGPQHGTLQLNADGSFSYTIGAGFSGIDSFTYIVSSGGLVSNSATVTLLSQPAAVVRKLYNQVLLRNIDTAGLTYWTRFINSGGSYAQVAQGVLESDERLNRLIDGFYQQYLHRSIDSVGLAFWRDNVWKRDGGPQNVEAGIIGSAEFYASSGGTDVAWVTALYQRLLNRSPDPVGRNAWVAALANHMLTRQQIVLGFVQSRENYIQAVDGWYHDYLGREPDPQSVNGIVAVMQAGASDRTVQLLIIGSDEYRSTPPTPPNGTANRIA